ncbi:MAG: EutN/CcmL family microcompartment protein [Anaerolineae bacterium]|nr:EutN/CcmL family microcompartment protein [Anaerolineae bacterium]
MKIARVIGTTISTIKDEKVRGRKLLIVRQSDARGVKKAGSAFVAVDLVDAGQGDLVLIGEGSSARQTDLTKDCPVDAVIVGVLDSLHVDGEAYYLKTADNWGAE